MRFAVEFELDKDLYERISQAVDGAWTLTLSETPAKGSWKAYHVFCGDDLDPAGIVEVEAPELVE